MIKRAAIVSTIYERQTPYGSVIRIERVIYLT